MIIRGSQRLDIGMGILAEQISGRLRDRFQRTLSEQPGLRSLNQAVLLWIREAMSFGVVNQDDVEFYASCKMIFGPAFPQGEENLWAASILTRSDLDGETKMDQIEEHMLFGLGEPI